VIALTIRQPYAWRVVHGSKTVENRTRPTQVRGRVLIHAGAQPHEHFRGKPMEHLPMSAIVGAVQLVGSHPASACVTSGRCIDRGALVLDDGTTMVHDEQGRSVHHWELGDAIAFSDADVVRDVRGALGFWQVTTPSTVGLVRLALEVCRV
jgi:ASCH domain